jgi:hypothetical protein
VKLRGSKAILAGEISETALETSVLSYAKLRGWRTAHFRPAQDRRGRWKTPVSGDGAGFPDLVMLRAERLVIAELKSERAAEPDAHQRAWLVAWRAAGAEVHVWRPSDLDRIYETLR